MSNDQLRTPRTAASRPTARLRTPVVRHRTPHAGAAVLAFGTAGLLALTACAPQGTPTSATRTPSATATPTRPSTPSATAATVPGYDVGQFPPVPLFLLPDLALLDRSANAFTIEVGQAFDALPGVTVAPAHCDTGGTVVAGHGSAMLYGDGSGNYTGPDGTIQNFGDGSGNSTIGGTTIQNFGDGSGNYSDGTVTIQNFGDGSGNYTDATKTVQIFGDGSGNYTDRTATIQNFGDGAGNYTDGTVTIQNFGDGSGNYTNGTLTIQNFGDGKARVDGVEVPAAPLPKVPKLGSFPPLAALAPIASCGTVITFQDGVLFDFDRSDIRADAVPTLTTVAQVLKSKNVPRAVITGHTDAIGSDAENQTLSEDRADSVVTTLRAQDVATAFEALGYGESRPVAPNEIDGGDNPAGRQLNRRVEIFLPAAG